jgi:S-adenosylmethionine:tRNA ribosyltransferase-isomerase
MQLSDFDYYLPKELIAQTPADPRDSSRLMVVNCQTQKLTHAHFFDLDDFLRPGDVLVRNNTKVIPARILARKKTGGKIEVLLNKVGAGFGTSSDGGANSTTWEAITKPGLDIGESFEVLDGQNRVVLEGKCVEMGKDKYTRIINFDLPYSQFLTALAQVGITPLPPYIQAPAANDKVATKKIAQSYQTIFARFDGSAAAPTAGLHMTKNLETTLIKKGVQIEEITLHVGLGTFLPVKSDDPTKHHLHAEWFSLSSEVASRLNQAKKEGRRIISMGTTTTRVLETCAITNSDRAIVNSARDITNSDSPTSHLDTSHPAQLTPQTGETSIFIYPPYSFKFVDALITNFHLPKSSLLMLVSAFVSQPNTTQLFANFQNSLIGKAYLEAVKNEYRFFSFGDGMLILPD